jgi:diadenosine tetraphosphatase ApaH/serine/threonine PP2A family protein phosphatase
MQKLKVDGRRPTLPPGIRIYAVGDIHGRVDLLDNLLSRIGSDLSVRPASRALCVFLGDYIDRGPSSRETIDRLIEYGLHNEAIFLKGNHELLAIRCLSDPGLFDQWMRLGGLETLISYGVAPDAPASARQIVELQAAFHAALPQSHLRFLRNLRLSFSCGDFFFAHAGVRPGVELSKQRENDLLWIRNEFLWSDRDFGKIVVHGHTPALEVEVEANRINIDTGAFATGRLTSLVIEEGSLSVIDTA